MTHPHAVRAANPAASLLTAPAAKVAGGFQGVAALFVETGGSYYGIPGVDPWDEDRDARKYAGPWPVVAHPPCQRWGRYWSGGPSAKVKRLLGDDDGCFASAIASVREWGGILEHPEASHAWAVFGLNKPPRSGRWIRAGMFDPGWTCCVEQGAYGHRARKATWLYAVGVDLPELRWGRAPGAFLRLEPGYRSTAEARAKRASGEPPIERLKASERAATPPEFRDLLIGIARSAHPICPQDAADRRRDGSRRPMRRDADTETGQPPATDTAGGFRLFSAPAEDWCLPAGDATS